MQRYVARSQRVSPILTFGQQNVIQHRIQQNFEDVIPNLLVVNFGFRVHKSPTPVRITNASLCTGLHRYYQHFAPDKGAVMSLEFGTVYLPTR